MKKFFTCILFNFISVISLFARSVGIEAHFSQKEVAINQNVEYVIEISGALPNFIRLPDIPGMSVISRSTTQATQVINGKKTYKTSYKFLIEPTEIGTLEVPEFYIDIDNSQFPVPSAKITVVDAKNVKHNAQNTYASVQVACTNQVAYVGEYIPFYIDYIIRNDAQLGNELIVTSANEDFLEPKLNLEPEILKQRGATVYRIHGIVQAPRANDNAQFSLNTQLKISIEDAFGSFGFFAVSDQKTVNLTSDPVDISVRSIGKHPENFCGAIGDFTFKNIRISSDRALTGEPITISFDCEGHGNFPQIKAPEFKSTHDWKILPPKISKTQVDKLEYLGTKTFEYVLIPQKSGELELPNLSPVYFDITTHQLKSVHFEYPFNSVIVSRTKEAEQIVTKNIDNAIKNADRSTNSNASHVVQHMILQDTSSVKSLNPICYNAVYSAVLLITLLLFVMYFILKNLSSSNKVAGSSKKILRKELVQLRKTIDLNHTSEFFATAKQVIFKILKEKGINFKTYAEISHALNSRGINQKYSTWLEKFLHECDGIQFGNLVIDSKIMYSHLDMLTELINSLSK